MSVVVGTQAAYAETTLVRFIRARRVVSQIKVPGSVVALQVPTSVVRVHTGSTIDLIEGDDPFTECCGRLVVPWINRNGGSGVAYLDIPPPWPFTNAGLKTMLEARNALDRLRRPTTSGMANVFSLRLSKSFSLHTESAPLVNASIRRLLTRWPNAPVSTVNWQRAGRASGRILYGVTERRGSLQRSKNGLVFPRSVAHAGIIHVPVRITTISHLCGIAARRLGDVVPTSSEEREFFTDLRVKLQLVGVRSLRLDKSPDPPVSTWPSVFRGLYSALIQLLMDIEFSGTGEDYAPFSELWELYESWVTYAVVSTIAETSGNPVYSARHKSWTWISELCPTILFEQPTVPEHSDGASGLDVLGTSISGVLGESRPDLLIGRRSDGRVSLATLDAKKRRGQLSQNDFVQEAAKYLWNIRRTDSPSDTALDWSYLVSPLGGPTSSHPAGKAGSLAAVPSSDIAFPPEIVRFAREFLREALL